MEEDYSQSNGRHHLPAETPPGPDKLYPEHSFEERNSRTSALTGKDLSRAIGIVPRATPPGGLPADIPRIEPRPSLRQELDEGYGRSLETPLYSRIVAILVVIGICIGLLILLGRS